jgi:hypothetical protein
VGDDQAFGTRMVAETWRAEGLRAELLTADESGVDPIMGYIQGLRLLVAAADEGRVRSIIRRGGS